MIELTAEQFATRVVDAGLAEMADVDRARAELGSGEHSVDDLARVLQGRGLLTNLQAEKQLRGDRIGFFYGKYKVLYLIGAGTFARVYRAVHRETGQVVAVKVLRKRHRDDMQQMEQFLREGRMGLKLRHPNIVAIYEVEPDVRSPYMVMEFVEGQTLRELLKIRGSLPPDVALKVTHDVVSALNYAATQGVTHRDMKLSNVLITADGRAKLVDFGLAAISDSKNDRAVADCPNARAIDYAALERGTNVRNGDPRSDIFFVGCMLYHMLSGTNPLTETRDRMARLNVSRLKDITPLAQVAPNVPGPVLQLVNKAIEFDPNNRYQTAAELQAEVKQTMERLEQGEVVERRATESNGSAVPPEIEGQGRTVMIVESKVEMQNALRERLKSKGYRVLVISDPARALARFDPGEDPPADCVIFCAPELGSLALEAFNRFAMDEHTQDIPAILLVDRRQQHVIRHAKMAPHRMMLAMPLKVRQLRAALLRLFADRPKAEA